MRQVSRSGPRQHRADQAREGAPHTAGGLNVFGRSFGLPVHCHQPESVHVDTHGQHVGRQHHINGARVAFLPAGHILAGSGVELGLELDLQVIEVLGDVLARYPRCQLANVADAALCQCGPFHHAHLHAVGTCLHIVLCQSLHPAQLTQGVEVTDHGHVRVGRLAEVIEQILCCRQECGVDADQHRGA